MTDELDVLRSYRPTTSGPHPDVTEQASRALSGFLDSQAVAHVASHAKPSSTRWRRRPTAIVGLAAILLAAGGVAVAVIGDGVIYSEPETQIAATGDLNLVVQESNIGPCLEVRSDSGGMAGGCGADFSEPLSVGVGLVDGTSYVSGWAPAGTVEIVMVFPGGEMLSVTALPMVEGYDVVFFLASPVPSPGNEPSLPLEATAYDSAGKELGKVTYDQGSDGEHVHGTRPTTPITQSER